MVSISVALAIGRRLVLGIISAPCLGKTYSAIKGRGATLNGKPMKARCSQVSTLKPNSELISLSLSLSLPLC
jgi:fructose-1,6-bisphosphatase/inositol monophosphatase family enzyme